jgi:tRNA A-37 threonylcarbamoyl transferase component Bud32
MKRAQSLQGKGGPVFGFRPGRRVERHYILGEFIGSGYEGEVYHLTERGTGIERVVKFFYPDRYRDRRRSVRLARKFHRLRHCPVILQYHHHGELTWSGRSISYMISELAPGTILYDFLQQQPRKRLQAFEALHLTRAIVAGVAEIHALREYHGDIHEDNILVERRGVGFRVKLIDLYLHTRETADRLKLDVADIVNLLYMMVGGPSGYGKCPQIVKSIVCGRRRQQIYQRFPSAGALCHFMDSYAWPEG